jgi:hypothetical protein
VTLGGSHEKKTAILILIISASVLVVAFIVSYFMYAPAPLDTTLPPKLGHYVQADGNLKISFDVTTNGIENLEASDVVDSVRSSTSIPLTCSLYVELLTLDQSDSFSFTSEQGTTVIGTVHGDRANGKFMNHASTGCKSWTPDHLSYTEEQFEYLWQAEWVGP